MELARSSVSDLRITSIWTERLSETHSQLHILSDSASSDFLTEKLISALADTLEDIRIICLPVEASFPEEKSSSGMISYDELKQDIVEMTSPSPSTWILFLQRSLLEFRRALPILFWFWLPGRQALLPSALVVHQPL